MSAEKILSDLKNRNFKPVYWLEGEEPYFIDEVINYAEQKILSESQASFNLSVFYGKDAQWADVLNACKRYPMFSDLQVVLLKEAQQMKDKELEKLESYIESPLKTTLFFVSYKDKKLDARTKFAKTVKSKGELLSTKKLYDNQIPDWASKLVQANGLSINQKALILLIDHIGNDLSRIKNEIEKLTINLNGRKSITEDDIEKFIGVSKEFNVFELQSALAHKNFPKAMRINEYFASNPKAAPITVTIATLYNFFSKAYMVFGLSATDDRTVAAELGVSPFFVKDYLQAVKSYGQQNIEKILLLLHTYNLKSIGIGDNGTSDADLVKELIIKMTFD